jgi:hypothetical protein
MAKWAIPGGGSVYFRLFPRKIEQKVLFAGKFSYLDQEKPQFVPR